MHIGLLLLYGMDFWLARCWYGACYLAVLGVFLGCACLAVAVVWCWAGGWVCGMDDRVCILDFHSGGPMLAIRECWACW